MGFPHGSGLFPQRDDVPWEIGGTSFVFVQSVTKKGDAGDSFAGGTLYASPIPNADDRDYWRDQRQSGAGGRLVALGVFHGSF